MLIITHSPVYNKMHMKTTIIRFTLILIFVSIFYNTSHSQKNIFSPIGSSSGISESFFQSPDSTFYPGVWWWWLRCPTSKEAITLDLEEIKAKKIQSVQLLDFGTGGGQERMPEYLDLASSEWNEMVKHAILECKRLGLEFGMCIATSGCAAPWVTPEESQQRIVFSETNISGGKRVNIQLPYPSDLKKHDDSTLVFYEDIAVMAVLNSENVSENEMIDISSYMNNESMLTWNVPEGDWTIFRMGYTPTFKTMNEFKYLNHLRTDVFDSYYNKYIGDLLKSLTEDERSAVKYIISDSWEAGVAGWSPDFSEEFKKRRGYDLIPYLPLLTRKVAFNDKISKRVRDDYKTTVSDLIVEHYRYQQEVAHKNGLFTMCEASGPHQNQADALLCQKYSDVPMGEFWARANTHRTTLERRFLTKEAVSAGHIYGKNIISAESFTSVGPLWEEDPWHLKPTADRAFCEGINKFYFHTYSHSPSISARPGYVYYAGTHFNRNITWWDYSNDWVTYLIRSQYLLQQGIPHADVCFYYGSGIENRMEYKKEKSVLSPGYQYDYINSDVILNRMSVRDGKLYLPDGVSYEVMVLAKQEEISLEVLEKIKDLVFEGATIIGFKPKTSIGLLNYKETDRKVKMLADLLWGEEEPAIVDRRYGNGRVICGKSIDNVLAEKRLIPDVDFTTMQDSVVYDFTHRKYESGDIYFIANTTDKSDYLKVRFRVTGKSPQLWNPADGSIADAFIYTDDGQSIEIPMHFDPFGSIFVIFKDIEKKSHIVSVDKDSKNIYPQLPLSMQEHPYFSVLPDGVLAFNKEGLYRFKYDDGKEKEMKVPSVNMLEIAAPWQVSFSKDMGAPENITFDSLILWNNSDNPEIKYYSGMASYKNTFVVNDKMISGNCVYLDLGEMYNVAEIIINGKSHGTCWKKPFIKDIKENIKPGINEIEIRVVNLWPNRLIGDQFLPENERYTETNMKKFKKDTPLLPSGLKGPVRLRFTPIISSL